MGQTFLQKLHDIIHSNIGNASFSAKDLSEEIGMSQSNLLRKVRSLTGKSINQFIREVRLKRALEILKEEDVTISEVTFRIGFTSPSYFTACFGKFYGYPPGEVKKGDNDGIKNKDDATGPDSDDSEKDVSQGNKAKQGYKFSKLQIILASFLLFALTATVLILIFRNDDLRAMTEKVTVTDEFGKKMVVNVFNKEFVNVFIIFPFKNLVAEDTSSNWLSQGIGHSLAMDLAQFPYLAAWYYFGEDNYQEQIKTAKKADAKFFITGTYRKTADNINVIYRLYNPVSGSLVKEREFIGPDLFSLIDTISIQARLDMGLPDWLIAAYPDIPFSDQYTNSIEAFKCYNNAYSYPTGGAEFLATFKKSIDIDSTFAYALYKGVYYSHYYQVPGVNVKKYIQQAMRHKDRLNPAKEMSVRTLYYQIFGQNDKAIALAEMQHELDPDPAFLTQLANLYLTNLKFDKLQKTYTELAALYEDSYSKINLLKAYLLTGEFRLGKKLLNELLAESPDNTSLLLYAGEYAIHSGNYDAARNYFKKAILIDPKKEKLWSRIFYAIDFCREHSMTPEQLDQYRGIFRSESSSMEVEVLVLRNHLISKASNQGAFFLYFTSDSTAVGIRSDINVTWIFDNQGNITKEQTEQHGIVYTRWKKDALIQKAFELLESGNIEEALPAFQKAYQVNPQHYYLAHFIQHINFIQSPEYIHAEAGFKALYGTYNDSKVTIAVENGKLEYQNSSGAEWEILPLSEDLFMFPEIYSDLLQIEKDGDKINGISIVRNNGTRIFLKKDS